MSSKSAITLVLFGTLASVLMIEALARLIPGLADAGIQAFPGDGYHVGTIPDPQLAYKYAPDLVNQPTPFKGDESDTSYRVSTTSLGYSQIGFRDDGLDGDPFAVVIGDSFASCVGVELNECWVELLEGASGKDFANLGVIGYAPQQELQMLAQYGLPLEPPLVLWVFFVNDLTEARQFDQFGGGAIKEGKFWESPVRTWLAKHSVIYALSSFFFRNRYYFYHRVRLNDQVDSHNVAWALAGSDLSIPEIAEGLALTENAILTANDITRARIDNITFIVVIIPFKEQIYQTDTEHLARFDSTSTALVEFCRQNDILALDLTPEIREKIQDQSVSIYFSRDSHLNASGNKLVADLLEQNIEGILSQQQ